jgi:hypothetical protein
MSGSQLCSVRLMSNTDPPTPDWEALGVSGALLARYQRDQQAMLEQLATFLEGTLAAQTAVRRTHGLIGPKHTTGVTVELNGLRYVLERGRRDTLEARRTRVVRDVAVRTDTLLLERWLDELGAALGTELERTSAGRDALARLLHG